MRQGKPRGRLIKESNKHHGGKQHNTWKRERWGHVQEIDSKSGVGVRLHAMFCVCFSSYVCLWVCAVFVRKVHGAGRRGQGGVLKSSVLP